MVYIASANLGVIFLTARMAQVGDPVVVGRTYLANLVMTNMTSYIVYIVCIIFNQRIIFNKNLCKYQLKYLLLQKIWPIVSACNKNYTVARMKKPFTIIIFLMVFLSAALAGNPVKGLLNGVDSLLRKMYNKVDYDTAYIGRSPGKIGLKAWANMSGARLRAIGNNTRAKLRTDVKGTVSLEVDYYDLALELALNPTSFSGRNNDYEINFNFYPRHFVLDACYQMANTASGYIFHEGRSSDVARGWLASKTLNIDAYYTFNYRRFSYDAPFYQFYVQKQSAGSWLAGISYQGGKIQTTDDVPDKIPTSKFEAQHIGVGGGYAYNLVAGKWLFHLSVIPNIIVWSGNNIEMNGEKVYTQTKFPTVLMNSRAGIVHYFSQRSFVGMSGIFNTLLKRKSQTEIIETKWMLRLFYGMRI